MLNLTANDKLEGQPVFIRQILKKMGQNNKEYYHLEVSSGVKNYDAKIWYNKLSIAREITPGCIAYIWGTAREFKGTIQIHIDNIEPVTNPAKELLEELLPSSSLEEMKLSDEIDLIIESINTPEIKSLLKYIFKSPEIKNGFFKKAAGAEIHHAYVGGLAEHTLEVAKTVIHFCSLFKYINYDIAVAAALLHDIGKVRELSDFPENRYTTDGRLLGHIYMGTEILNSAASQIDNFPKKILVELQHCILSHHGTQEAGSPVLPMTIEATALHHADKASAEINGFNLAIQRDCGTDEWTEYNSIYKRYIKKR
ncbi:3'-5' exoribonuclease YhaM family protein [Fonticella tunisiensis]|uniref:3'-5' exoribonuclease n=1 Tax=Fonticella tunisiensis TaxID=1096341 RepID=A0A4R7KAE9_9CLOT|nr:HD domain-containing protein [Fonticella tunisiensis]TDT50915.1 3'-5' exoribonuclease [Fonticella tunisiensis]